MINRIKDWLKSLAQLFPNYGGLTTLGYRAGVRNNNFFLHKQLQNAQVCIYQNIEPFDSKLDRYMDFDLEEGCACVVIEFSVLPDAAVIEQIRSVFDYTYERQQILFMFDKQMELDDEHLTPKIMQIEVFLGEK